MKKKSAKAKSCCGSKKFYDAKSDSFLVLLCSTVIFFALIFAISLAK